MLRIGGGKSAPADVSDSARYRHSQSLQHLLQVLDRLLQQCMQLETGDVE